MLVPLQRIVSSGKSAPIFCYNTCHVMSFSPDKSLDALTAWHAKISASSSHVRIIVTPTSPSRSLVWTNFAVTPSAIDQQWVNWVWSFSHHVLLGCDAFSLQTFLHEAHWQAHSARGPPCECADAPFQHLTYDDLKQPSSRLLLVFACAWLLAGERGRPVGYESI